MSATDDPDPLDAIIDAHAIDDGLSRAIERNRESRFPIALTVGTAVHLDLENLPVRWSVPPRPARSRHVRVTLTSHTSQSGQVQIRAWLSGMFVAEARILGAAVYLDWLTEDREVRSAMWSRLMDESLQVNCRLMQGLDDSAVIARHEAPEGWIFLILQNRHTLDMMQVLRLSDGTVQVVHRRP